MDAGVNSSTTRRPNAKKNLDHQPFNECNYCATLCKLFFLWRLLGCSRTSDAIRRTAVREESWGWSSDTRGIHTFGPKGPECWLWHMELHQAFLGEFAQDFLCRIFFFCCSLLLFQHQQHLHTVKRVSRCKIMQKISGWCHVGHGILILLRDWKMGFAWHPQILDLWTSKLCDWYCAIKIHGWGWQEN